jgi:hypothetical protein
LVRPEKHRSDEGPSLIQLTGGLKRSREGRAALQEEAGDVTAAKVGKGSLDAVGNQDLGAGIAQRGPVGFGRDHDEHRRLVECLEQL